MKLCGQLMFSLFRTFREVRQVTSVCLHDDITASGGYFSLAPGQEAPVVQYLLLALGAVPGASGGRVQGRVETAGVEGSGAAVAGLQLSVLLTDGTLVLMLQLLLHTQQEHLRKLLWGQFGMKEEVKPLERAR